MSLFGLLRKAALSPQHEGAKPPETYVEWSAWFDRFECGDDDDTLLELARSGRLTWNRGTATAFSERAASTLQARMEAVRTMLQNGVGRSKDERDVISAVINARRAFSRLSRYAELPCWPAPLPQQLGDMLRRTREAIQQSLLDSSKSDRTGRLLKVLRDNPLDRHILPPVETSQSGASPSSQTRRILL